jgi:hypothetical protein
LPIRQCKGKIENAIETMSVLYLLQTNPQSPESLKKEIRRMIIMYASSIIEAVLLHLYKKGGFAKTRAEYSIVRPLPKEYQYEQPTSRLVIAKEVFKQRTDRELMLDYLLTMFSNEGVIKPALKKRIVSAKDVRNTFHLSKSRQGLQCTQAAAESAMKAALDTITLARNRLLNP